MSQVLTRKPLTDAVLDKLRETSFPVGDAEPPPPPAPGGKKAGWNGQPNTTGSFYVPYVVVTPSAIGNFSGSFAEPQADVQVPYQLSFYGISRQQVELLSDRCRRELQELRKAQFSLGDVPHKVQQVWVNSVGGIGRVDAADPPVFGEIDTITIWLTK